MNDYGLKVSNGKLRGRAISVEASTGRRQYQQTYGFLKRRCIFRPLSSVLLASFWSKVLDEALLQTTEFIDEPVFEI